MALPTLEENVQVWMKTDNHQQLAKLKSKADTPRSCLLDGLTRQIRWNHQHITIVSSTPSYHRTDTTSTSGHNSLHSTHISTRSKTITVTHPSDHLHFYRREDVETDLL